MVRAQQVRRASWSSRPQELASQPHLHLASSPRPLAPCHPIGFHGSLQLQVEIAPSQSCDTPILQFLDCWCRARHHQHSSSCTHFSTIPHSCLIVSPSCHRSLSLSSPNIELLSLPLLYGGQGRTLFTQVLTKKQSYHENRDFKWGHAKVLCMPSPRTRRKAWCGAGPSPNHPLSPFGESKLQRQGTHINTTQDLG